MTDIASWTYGAAAHRSALAAVGSLALGVLSGLGPCALARGAAIASLTEGTSKRNLAVCVFAYAVGAAAGYVAYGVVTGFALRLSEWSTYSYIALSAVLLVTGLTSILRPSHGEHGERVGSAGGASLLGLGGSIAFSPCCTPFVFALTGIAFGDIRYAALLLCCFTLGHVIPAALLAVAARAGRSVRVLRPELISFATGTISLAMAGYYGVLA